VSHQCLVLFDFFTDLKVLSKQYENLISFSDKKGKYKMDRKLMCKGSEL
jgi:hypothetical protein